MIVKVEEGIAIPPKKLVFTPKQKDPNSLCGIARTFSVGQSAFFAAGSEKTAKGLAQGICKEFGKGAAVTRKVDGGMRVWRVK